MCNKQKKYLFESYIPTKYIQKDFIEIINDFQFLSNDTNVNDVKALSKQWFIEHTTDVKIKIYHSDLVDFKKITSFFLLENKIVNKIIEYTSTHIIVQIVYNSSVVICEKEIIEQNINYQIQDLYNCLQLCEIHLRDSINSVNSFDFYNNIIKNNFFIKLNCSLYNFMQFLYTTRQYSQIYASLVKLHNIEICNKFNIHLSGMSDIADVKKDIIFIINNINIDNIDVINYFFELTKIDDTKNILYIRITRILCKTILCMYEHFKITLKIIDKINIYYNLMNVSNIKNDLHRVFKLFKSVKRKHHNSTINSVIIRELEHILNHQNFVYVVFDIITFIDTYNISSMHNTEYKLFITCYVHALNLLSRC
jgi:hypothetical protein